MSDNVNCQSNCECECELGAHGIDAVIDAEPEVLLFADCLHTGNSVITKCTQTPMLQVAESHSDGGALALGTSSMKCKLIEAMPVLESRALVGNEMSMSLPDLTLGLQDIGLIDRDVKLVRNSLTDIAVKTHADAFAKQSSDMKMDLNFTECQQLCNGGSDVAVQAKTYSKEESPSLLKLSPSTLSGTSSDSVHSGSESSENSVTVTVGPTNNRLSAVLENIPLLYLPHTKQLIRPSPRAAPTLGSLNASNPGNNMPIEKCHFSETLDHRSLSSIQADLPIIDSDVTATEILSTSSGTTTARPNAPYSTSDHDSHSTAGSNVLSQDSDISFKSDLTVINLDDDKDDHAIPLEEFTQGSNGLMASNTLDSGVVCDFSHIIPDGNNTLERTNTNSSLTRTDASSFSSISSISTGTEFSAASFTEDAVAEANELDKSIVDTDEAGFVDINLNARNSYERNHSKDSSQDSGIDTGRNQAMLQQGVKPKKRGITSFLARSLFSRKTKEAPPNEGGVLGWRLFGKVPPKQTAVKEASVIEQEYKASQQQLQHACSGPIPQADPQGEARVKKSDIEAPSTTALILEQRPQGLPSKDPEEELRHRQEYEAMVAAARKKEQRDIKQRKKQMQHQHRVEDALSAAGKVWNNEILPNWETMHTTKKARDLWWHGIPPSLRGRIWQLAIGNELNLTPELYEICLLRAKDRLKIMREAGSDTDSLSSFTESSASREASVDLIKLDGSRTFPQLCIFQKGGPYHEHLQGLLGAYACYRPDVGYVQGMSFIAAVLLLNLDVNDAFICFANLLNQPCQIAFFRLDECLMKSYFDTYEEFFQENLPHLFAHFIKQNITSDLYIIDWMFTLYAKSLPLDVASHVWDVFCRDGEEFLFRTALGILRLYEDILLNMDFIHLAQFLTRLPEHMSGADLFHSIDQIRMSIDKKKFGQVLAEQRDIKQRKKQMQHQHRVEDALSAAGKVWNNEILPNWETMHTTKKARDLWWHGIPPSLRGRIWQLAIGNELNLTPELYEICLLRAKDRLKIMREAGSDTDSLSSFTESSASREASVDLIKLDGSRTFPQLCIFQKGGPYHEHLQGLLGAYACYRPDVGYVQGMSFIAAVLLLNLDVNDAFICFANLLNQPCQIAFFRLDECLMKSYFDTYEEFFQENLPHLFAHFIKQNITSDLYIIDWMFTLYAKSLPLDVASHVWDVFCRDGEEFLFRTALGILRLYEDILLNMDFIHLAQFLTRLPEHMSGADLFHSIDQIRMSIDKKKFGQVLAGNRDLYKNMPTTES